VEEVYNDCVEEFRNPAKIEKIEATIEYIKDAIIAFERSLKEGELDSKKIAAGIELTGNKIPDYNYKRVEGKKGRDSGDLTKAFLSARNTTSIRKRPSGKTVLRLAAAQREEDTQVLDDQYALILPVPASYPNLLFVELATTAASNMRASALRLPRLVRTATSSGIWSSFVTGNE
jgi:hypothetical protein